VASALPRLKECPTVPEDVHMPSAVSRGTISRAIFRARDRTYSGGHHREGGDPQENIHSSYASTERNIIEVNLAAAQLYAGLRVSDTKKGTRPAHGAEGAGGNNISLLGCPVYAFSLSDVNHFLSSHHNSLTFSDFLVDFSYRLGHIAYLTLLK
jgi:hypothetical protein